MASVPVCPHPIPGAGCLIVCPVVADSHWNLDPSSNVLNSRPVDGGGFATTMASDVIY
jgi:hypothetical protein